MASSLGDAAKGQIIEEVPALTTFDPFRCLPVEIQDSIWQCAINNEGPRVVEIQSHYYKKLAGGPEGDYLYTGTYTSSCPIPAALHACSRSRILASRRWKRSFAFGRRPAKIYFDFSCDILYFGNFFGLSELRDQKCNIADRKAIRYIAFRPHQQWDDENFEDGPDLAMRLHSDFPALTQVFCIEEDGRLDRESNEMGRPHRTLNPKRRLLTLIPYLWGDDADCARYLKGFRRKYKEKGWTPPYVQYMNSHYLVPNCPPWQLPGESEEEWDYRYEENYGWRGSEEDHVGKIIVHDPMESRPGEGNEEDEEEDDEERYEGEVYEDSEDYGED
jgi:hypothetical protein